MAKSGLDYQKLVAIIESAFDPGATVIVGEWVEGPDGNRDCDVSIRGTREGRPFFAFAECKDWRRRIGIGTIDALDSKSKDLGADLTAIYSNSGFTAPAVQKARRVGINTFSAVASGDRRSRARVSMLAYGQVVTSVKILERVYEPSGQDLPIPQGLTMENIRYDGEPVHNWIVGELGQLIRDNIDELLRPSHITVVYPFIQTLTIDMGGSPFPVAGMVVEVDTAIEWRAKVVQLEPELGRFDAQTDLLWIPPNVPVTIWGIDNTQWEQVEKPSAQEQSGIPGVRISVWAHLQAGLVTAPGGTPDMSKHVDKASLSISPASP
jgi:hypothetical protein